MNKLKLMARAVTIIVALIINPFMLFGLLVIWAWDVDIDSDNYGLVYIMALFGWVIFATILWLINPAC